MLRAHCGFRPGGHYKKEMFEAGLTAAGCNVVNILRSPYTKDDVYLIWNRYTPEAILAGAVERAGGTVIVAENSYFGKRIGGEQWFALAIGHHNGAGQWPTGPAGAPGARWQALGVPLAPWRPVAGGEIVVLAQRGFGEPGVRSPAAWNTGVLNRIDRNVLNRTRLRPHPAGKEGTPLDEDLKDAEAVVTWGSGAAIVALSLGVPVYYEFPKWIGAMAARPLQDMASRGPNLDDNARLAMFERLAWAQWSAAEIESGVSFRTLLEEQARIRTARVGA